MTSTMIMVSEETARHLDALSFAASTDGKLRALLIAEYRRQFARHDMVDRILRQKYKMTFEEFEQQRIVEQEGYSWEVESDAIEWDFAVSGIRTMHRKLAELEETLPDAT